MEIQSSLLKYKEFLPLKNSIESVSAIDGKEKFRVKMVEYINDTSDNNDDMFFYDMLPFTRFLKPSDDSIAYTTNDHIIYLNSPGKVGENVRIWDFIYCHECLHQLWDTFDVGNKIKNSGLEYNHNLLNIASDCVINDYLKTLRKKEPFNDGIFPETLKDEFGVEYDRKNDTQYSLYIKLLKVYEKFKDKMDKLSKELENKEGENSQSSNNSNGSGSFSGSSNSNSNDSNSSSNSNSNGSNDSNGGDNSGKSKELNANDAQNAANEAKKNAEDLQKRANSNNTKELNDAADKAKDAAKRAQEAADKAKECAKNGDKEGERKAAEEAEAAANEAKRAAEESGNKSEKENSSSQKSKAGTSPASNNDIIDSDENLDEIRKSAEEIIKKYKDKLTGYLGEFLNKCESSKALKREGLKVNTARGISGWNNEMNRICKAFVKKKIFQKKRQYENTYSRVKRGSGFVKFGKPIDPGRKIKEDKMDINVAFYIDRSGSMSNSIDNVFNAVFYIANALKKYFGKEKVVNDTIFESYAFDTELHKLQFGKKMHASGGTLSFNKLLDYINENTKDFLINVIVTDAQFSDINTSTVKDLLNNIDGIVIFITNTANETMEQLSKKYPTKLNYILADYEFTLS